MRVTELEFGDILPTYKMVVDSRLPSFDGEVWFVNGTDYSNNSAKCVIIGIDEELEVWE